MAVRAGFGRTERLSETLDANDRKFGCLPYHYRHSTAETEDGGFLACTFWMMEARALLGQHDIAKADFDGFVAALDRDVGVYSKTLDPTNGSYLDNLPQGLTHLALIAALTEIE